MAFNSFNFLLFFPVVIILFYSIPARFRWYLLLVASYYFYINIKPVYILLLAGVTLTTFVFTLLIDKTQSERKKKQLLIIDIIITLLPLFFFKYFGFVNEVIYELLDLVGIKIQLPNISLLLPVGISFYTFMAVGYSIDVYNEEIRAEKKLGIVALFLSFFPLVLSGPIERAPNMFHQFSSKLVFNNAKIIKGLKLMLWGYFMKLVIAERVALYVYAIFNNIEHHSGPSLLFATMLYPIQVYADLGGYSLIAIGCANIMGIDIIPNFKRPFFATSMSDFWRRWHISLISWLTDYIFKPLSFILRKYEIWGIVISLLLTFFISGIWHGAALTFVIWGTIQGIVLSIEALTNRKKTYLENKYNLKGKSWYIIISCLITYIIFAFSLIFAGAVPTVSDAFAVIGKIFTNTQSLFLQDKTIFYSFMGISILFVSEFINEYFPGKFDLFNNKKKIIRWSAYLCIFLMIILTGVLNGGQFIYFQF